MKNNGVEKPFKLEPDPEAQYYGNELFGFADINGELRVRAKLKNGGSNIETDLCRVYLVYSDKGRGTLTSIGYDYLENKFDRILVEEAMKERGNGKPADPVELTTGELSALEAIATDGLTKDQKQLAVNTAIDALKEYATYLDKYVAANPGFDKRLKGSEVLRDDFRRILFLVVNQAMPGKTEQEVYSLSPQILKKDGVY